MKAFIFVFLVFSSTLFSKENTELLFVGFDAGETHIFVQVLKSWSDAPESQVLTMATASKVAKDASLNPVIEVESLGISCPSNQRLFEYAPDQLEKLSALSTRVLVTGMYSAPQRQIAEAFSKKGSKVVAIWDNFSPYEKLSIDLVANIEKIVQVATVVLVPSEEIAQDINFRFHTKKAVAAGQPTLELWHEKIAQIDRKAALAKTSLSASAPIVAYISGYEEKGNGYYDSFITFAKSIGSLNNPPELIVQLHPRSDGSFEKKVLEEYSTKNPKFPKYFISDGKQLSTFEAVAVSDLGVCQRSTVAIQALFAGKRFMHIDLPGTPFSHFAIEKHLIIQCTSSEDAASYIQEHLKDPIHTRALYKQAGIPEGATQKFRTILKDLLIKEQRSLQPCADENAGIPSKL